MMKSTVQSGILVDKNLTISFVQVCQICHLSKDTLLELLDHGLFSQLPTPFEQQVFDSNMVHRLHAARRLQEDLGINLAGVVLALELRDELEKLQQELDFLRRHVAT